MYYLDASAILKLIVEEKESETGYELVDVAEEEPWKSIR